MVEHLAENIVKIKWAEMMDSMTQNAKNSGLDFHFESNYGQFIQCTPTLAFG
jgi:hypothetical protein